MPKPGTLTKAHLAQAIIKQIGYTRKKAGPQLYSYTAEGLQVTKFIREGRI